MPRFRIAALSVILFAYSIEGGASLCAQTRPCEDAIAAIVAAGGMIKYDETPPAEQLPALAERDERENNGSDPCRNLVEVNFWRIKEQAAVIATLPGIPTLDRPDAITLNLDRVDPAYFDEVAAHAAALGKLKAIELRSDWTELLSDRDLAHLSRLSNLKSLSLHTYGDGLTDDGLVHLRNLSRLKWLNVTRARITDAGLSHLSELESLESFSADRTDLTGAGLSHLNRTPLKSLSMIETKLDDAGLENVGRLQRLEWLSVAQCLIDGTGLIHLAPLRNLRRLALSSTSVNDTTLATLPQLPGLRSLDLSSTRITDRSVDFLAARTSLRTLELRKTDVTEGGIRRLQAANPQLRVEF